MNIVPIVFAFDKGMSLPAAVCIFSLLKNAETTTSYDIFILYPADSRLDEALIDKVINEFPDHKLTYIPVKNGFEGKYEIRGINNLTYYRLLIPDLIPQYDKIVYSDVDVIFQSDLYSIYSTACTDDQVYIYGVNSLAQYDDDMRQYYEKLGLDSSKIIYAGNIILNSKKLREDKVTDKFISLSENKYKYQDLDIINIACENRIGFLPLWFCMTTYMHYYAVYDKSILLKYWTNEDILLGLRSGIVHYNGPKPWNCYCPNFDQWWQYYRESPVFDEKYYFDFYYNKLDELDQLPLLKRVKILVRYFVYGKRKNP